MKMVLTGIMLYSGCFGCLVVRAAEFEGAVAGDQVFCFFTGTASANGVLEQAKGPELATYGLFYGRFNSPLDISGAEVSVASSRSGMATGDFRACYGYKRLLVSKGPVLVSVDVGIGVSIFSTDIANQGSRFNFTEYIGASVYHPIDSSLLLTANIRLDHISNAGIVKPNTGVETTSVFIGVTSVY